MSIGPRMSGAVRYLITKEALRDRNEPRRVVAARLQRLIAGDLKEAVPREETILKMVSHIRNHAPDDSDAPWSMAHLNSLDCCIPTVTLPTVLQTWRYTVATHEPFSIRQAKWASRLHSLFTEPVHTWWWSLRYAFAEKASTLSKIPFETTTLDAQLLMEPGELEATTHTGATEQRPHAWGFNRFFPYAADGSPEYELLHLPEFAVSPTPIEDLLADDASRLAQLCHLIDALPPLDSLGLPLEKKYEYLHWLTFMYTGPLWQSLTPNETQDILLELRKRVTQGSAAKSTLPAELLKMFPPQAFDIAPSLSHSIAVFDLLQRVGL